MPNWTKSQQQAIDAKDSNILVSAAAGSGKTAVLVERVIKKITDENNPIDIDKLLIVTFTKAAAAQMKEKIHKALNNIIIDQPNNSNVMHQLSLLPNAKICTIDSFCINFVRDYFFNLDISQDFKIMDNSEENILSDMVINEILEEKYSENSDIFNNLVKLLSNEKTDNGLVNTIKELNRFICAHPFPFDWLDEVSSQYDPSRPLNKTLWYEFVVEQSRELIDYSITLVNTISINLSTDDDLYPKYCNLIDEDKSLIVNISESLNDDWNIVKSKIESIKFSRMPSVKKGSVSINKEPVNNLRSIYKEIFSKKLPQLFMVTQEEYSTDCNIVYPVLLELVSIVKEYSNRLLQLKKDRNAYCFVDIMHFAINLLYSKDENGSIVQTSLCDDCKKSYEEILVDEYQDTNRAQDKLFEMMSNGQNRFMVGDVKQSIYRFRMAMPQIFTEKKNTFDFYSSNSNSKDQKIILDKNFRSRKEICDFTNFLFSKVMSQKVGELEYTTDEYLYNGSDYKESNISSIQVKLCNVEDGEIQDEVEAYQIAKYINEKIKNKEQIKDGEIYRDINYGDFTILLRSMSSHLPIYSKILTEQGIPIVCNNKVNLFENNEVSILVSFLRVIDNPTLDIPMVATLMSPFYGFSAQQIANAKLENKGKNIYLCIKNDQAFSTFIDDLNKYRSFSTTMTVSSFIRQIIFDKSFFSLISAMDNSQQRQQNIYQLIELANKYDNGDSVGLTSFIRFIDKVIDSKYNIDSANDVINSENSVKIMSIHHSKGLEFPVCILAGTTIHYNFEDLKKNAQVHPENGIGLKVYVDSGMYRYNTLQYNCIKEMNKYALMSEYLRTLYVAITRSKEQFVTFITKKNIYNYPTKYSKIIIGDQVEPMAIANVDCDAGMILLACLLHKDGKCIRDNCSEDIKFSISDFDIDVQYLDSYIPTKIDSPPSNEYDENLLTEISNKLEFTYNRNELSGFVSKRTASSLDEKQQDYKYIANSKPDFMCNGGLTSAQKGTAMHEFMQYCDYNNAKNDLESEIDRLLEYNYLSKIQANSLDRNRLNNFFNSNFAERMFNADNLYREIKLSSFVSVSKLEKTDYEDKVLIQGIADCVFEENGELVLVDYKTDKVDTEDELLERYKNQLEFYKYSVEKRLNKPVKEVNLYSFWLNKECIYK